MHSRFRTLLWSVPLVGSIALSNSSPADSAGLPESLIAYERPAFPVELSGTSIHEGYATVAFIIGSEGEIDDAVVLEASHAAFGKTVLNALPTWHFDRSADVLPRREVIRFSFKQDGVVNALSHREAAKTAFALSETRLPIRTVAAPELANAPQRVTSPTASVRGVGHGDALVSYVIDTTGRVRVPVVLSASRPELVPAAIALVKDWRFSPSTHEGNVVLVEDRRSLTFRAKE